MKNILAFILCLCASFACAQTQLNFTEPVKQRVFVLTDITNEPDDQQSLVRLLVYSNEYDIEGMVATTSTHLRTQVRQDKIEELIRSYGQVKSNLDVHATGFPSMDSLLSVTSQHLPAFSMEGVGRGKDSPGSELLIKAVDKEDERPLWVSVWGGANCLAQALWKVKNTRSLGEVKKFVDKIRVYTISDQDFTGEWIRHNFPGIFYIVDPSVGDNWREYYKATWTGISGDRSYLNGPYYQFELVDNPWLKANIFENHGPLGVNYLPLEYLMEGDTPSFIGLIQNGLAWDQSPSWGGWAGRYELWKSYGEVDKIWTSSIYTLDRVTLPDGRVEISNQATIWRFRDAFQYDFAARMDWNVADTYEKANHNPVAVVNGNEGKAWASGKIKEGEQVTLSAKGSHDPDENQIQFKWWLYREAGYFTGKLEIANPNNQHISFTMPKLENGQSLHLILEVRDSGIPALTSYRRVVLTHE